MFPRLWDKITHKLHQCIYQSPVTEEYLVCVVLANLHTCLYGNQVSEKFECRPPTVPEYLASAFIDEDENEEI